MSSSSRTSSAVGTRSPKTTSSLLPKRRKKLRWERPAVATMSATVT
ncbi:hypothetical protein ACWDXD_02470 [Streptomyces sp. NPDC003314]